MKKLNLNLKPSAIEINQINNGKLKLNINKWKGKKFQICIREHRLNFVQLKRTILREIVFFKITTTNRNGVMLRSNKKLLGKIKGTEVRPYKIIHTPMIIYLNNILLRDSTKHLRLWLRKDMVQWICDIKKN